MRPFFVYMLRCHDGSYYVGHTDELERRVEEHHAGLFPGYTSERRPLELVWFAEMVTREDALERELQLKRWTRRKKEALIAGDWARVKALSRGKDRVVARARPPFDCGPAEQPERSGTGPTLRANGLGASSEADGGSSGPSSAARGGEATMAARSGRGPTDA